MRTNSRNRGVFTPQDLTQMREELNREASPSETALDREARAAEIIYRMLAKTDEE